MLNAIKLQFRITSDTRYSAYTQLNAFVLLVLYRVSRGESIRNIDTDTLNKLLSQELLIDTANGIQLTPLYEEMKQRAGVIDRTGDKDVQADDTINVPINASGLATMFNVFGKTIKRDLYVLRDLYLIKYVGSNKTGHWEILTDIHK